MVISHSKAPLGSQEHGIKTNSYFFSPERCVHVQSHMSKQCAGDPLVPQNLELPLRPCFIRFK